MDALALLRTLGALAAVLALLAAALWAVRRYDVALPGRVGGRKAARLAVAERLSLDPKRSVAIIRHGATEHLLLLAPEGNMVLGTADEADTAPLTIDLTACREEAMAAPLHIDLAQCRAARTSFASAVPIPPAPPPALWPALPKMPVRPASPRHDPIPARRA